MNFSEVKLYGEYRVVEENDPLAVHCVTWDRDRAEYWIGTTGRFFFPGRSFSVQGRRIPDVDSDVLVSGDRWETVT